MHILGIKVSGYRLLKDKFTIDFRTKAKVDSEFEYEDEVMNLLPKIDYPRTTIFSGANASGKTTILRLISLCLTIAINGTCRYHKHDFTSETIDLEFIFEMNEELMKYHGIINKPMSIASSPETFNYCLFSKEELYKRSSELKLKKDDIFDGYNIPFKTRSDFSTGTILPHLSICGVLYPNDDYKKMAMYIGSNHSSSVREEMFYFNRFFSLPNSIKANILKILDSSIENIDLVSKEKGIYSLKRFNQKAKILDFIDLYNLLSSGTSRGIIIFSHAYIVMKFGGILIIDEVENSFHSSLVGDLIFLFNNDKINKNNATLVVSTHYSDVLNLLRRRDSIYICHKKDSVISVKNMYEYDIRTELSKSNLYDNNKFNNLVNYESLMNFREAFNHEITRSSRGQ